LQLYWFTGPGLAVYYNRPAAPIGQVDKTHMDSENTFNRSKIAIYERALVLGILTCFAVWAFSEATNLGAILDGIALPAIGLYCLASLILFRKYRQRYLRTFEIVIFIGVCLYFSAHIAYTLWSGVPAQEIRFRKFFLWMNLPYVMAFLFFSPGRGVRLSLLYFAYILLAGMGFMLLPAIRTGPNFLDNLLVLVEMSASGLVYIALLYIIVALKEGYVRATLHSDRMVNLASTDALTGAYNRLKCNELIRSFVESSRSSGQPFAVILLDVDNFKSINDVHGHAVGDDVLRWVVDVLDQNVRDRDIVGRWGGDEFIVLCPGLEEQQIKPLIARLESSMRTTKPTPSISAGASFGFAEFHEQDTVESLFERADKSMYESKRRKKAGTQLAGVGSG